MGPRGGEKINYKIKNSLENVVWSLIILMVAFLFKATASQSLTELSHRVHNDIMISFFGDILTNCRPLKHDDNCFLLKTY